MNKRLKVLVIAAATHPDEGSEPGMGWKWVEALSAYHDLWVITGEYRGNREAIELRLKENSSLQARLKMYFVPWFTPRRNWLSRFCLRLWHPLYYRYYRQWHQEAFKLAKKLHEKIHFDLVHQLNMIGYREPGYLWKLDAPFVWGPVGGTYNVPLRFASILSLRQSLYHLAKLIINNLQLRYHRRVKAALTRANGFVTATSDGYKAFLRVTGHDSVVISETGTFITKKQLAQKSSKMPGSPLQLVWSGVHQSRKALPLALRALAVVRGQFEFHLHILGEGNMTHGWKRLARKLNQDDHCTWYGWIDHEQAISILGQGDVFVFTSLAESTPHVVLESLSMGVPVICLDHCGMADVVTTDCGVKIPVTTPKKVINGLADAIFGLAKNPDELRRLSKGALKHAQELSWDSRAQQMLKVYQQAIIHWQKGNM